VCHIDPHGTSLGAQAAADAGLLVPADLVGAQLREQGVPGPRRAEVLAEAPAEEEGEGEDGGEEGEGEGQARGEGGEVARTQAHEDDEGIPGDHPVPRPEGGPGDEGRQEGILRPAEDPVDLGRDARAAELPRQDELPDPLEELLEGAQGADIAAVGPPEEDREKGHAKEGEDHAGEESGEGEARPEQSGEEHLEAPDRADGVLRDEAREEEEEGGARREHRPADEAGGLVGTDAHEGPPYSVITEERLAAGCKRSMKRL